MAPTDSEKGQIPFESLPGEGQLEIVPLPDHLAELPVGARAVEGGVHVRPPGEEQPLYPVQELGGVLRPARGEDEGQSTGLLDRADVVLAKEMEAGPAVVVADRDPDGRPHHIRSGIGMPRRATRASLWPMKASTSIVRRARRSPLSAYSSEYFGFW